MTGRGLVYDEEFADVVAETAPAQGRIVCATDDLTPMLETMIADGDPTPSP